jgi:hypothetical protein
MAKKRQQKLLHHRIAKAITVDNKRPSTFTKDDFHLGKHDEDKMLLFATGIVLGIGLGASILGAFWYGGIAAIVIALVLLLVETRQ